MFRKNVCVPHADEAPVASAPSAPLAKVSMPALVITVLGFCASLYALIEHLQAKAGQAGQLACDINEKISCSTVLTSEYGEFLSIPLGGWGMAFWGGVLALVLLPKFVHVSEQYLARWHLVSSGMGFVSSLGLGYIAYFVLHAICPVCSATYVICAIYLIWALVNFKKHRTEPMFAQSGAFIKLVALGMTFGIPPLIAAFLAPSIAESIAPAKSESAAPKVNQNVASTPIPEDLLKISRSNFVGKGEDYRIGNENARVVITIFTDPQCPFCAKVGETMDSVMKTSGNDVLYVVHFYPLDSSCNPKGGAGHQHACRLSMAARCAGQQGKFWDVLHWAYQNQRALDADAQFSANGIKQKAQSLGLDMNKFSQCLDSKAELPKIQDDIALGDKLGLTGTPLVLINGRKFEGHPGDPEAFLREIRSIQGR